MKSKFVGVLGGVVIVGGLIAYFAWSGIVMPSDVQPSKTFKPVPAVLKGGEDLTALTSDLEKHGDLPIKLDPSEIGREDPLSQP